MPKRKHTPKEECDDGAAPKEASQPNAYFSDLHDEVYVVKACSHEGCANKATEGGDVCSRHHGNNKSTTFTNNNKAKLCSHNGCSNVSMRRGVCWTHGAKDMVKVCSIEGCMTKSVRAGLCWKHGNNKKSTATNNTGVKLCSHDGCGNVSMRRGVCWTHGAKDMVKVCSHEGCMTKSVRGGLCWKHGAGELKKKAAAATAASGGKTKTCSHEGCTNIVIKKGVCWSHGAKDMAKICSFEGCTTKSTKRGLCWKHGGKTEAKICEYDGCTNQSIKSGVCWSHGAKKKARICSHAGCDNQVIKARKCWSHGANEMAKLCSIDGCTTTSNKRGLCWKHGGRTKVKYCGHDGCTNQVIKDSVCWRHGANGVAAPGMKPLFKVGTKVYAAYWADKSRKSKNPSFYPGVVSSFTCKGPVDDKYGYVRYYNIQYDDGDTLDYVSDQYVFDAEDYLLLIHHDNDTTHKWLGVRNVLDSSSQDTWAANVGWYAASIDGKDQSFSLLSRALRAYDTCVLRQKGMAVKESELNLPEDIFGKDGDGTAESDEAEESGGGSKILRRQQKRKLCTSQGCTNETRRAGVGGASKNQVQSTSSLESQSKGGEPGNKSTEGEDIDV